MSSYGDYSLDKHKHNLAAWAASRAASSSPKCRFKVQIGFEIIEKSGLQAACADWSNIPTRQNFDTWHQQTCVSVRNCVSENKLVSDPFTFSYGIAAKLVNCYMKVLFLGVSNIGPEAKEFWDNLHPPIDRLLLSELANKKVGGHTKIWRSKKYHGWSNFDQNDYEEVIRLVRKVTDGKLWRIEHYWPGHQR